MNKCIGIGCLLLALYSCAPDLSVKKSSDLSKLPETFNESVDTINLAKVQWKTYFTDANLIALIDVALSNNQELNITLQEIEIARNEVMARKGEYLPFLGVQAGVGVDKVGRYTRNGALEANNNIKPGKAFPEPLPDFMIGAIATWEVDIWRKLRNAKKSAYMKYLSSVEGKNFMVTNLVAEIASSYYELLALDTELDIVRQNIDIQNNALNIVKLQKQAARVTELAVTRFAAQVLSTKSLEFSILQEIVVAENRINFLLGRYPQPIVRNLQSFDKKTPNLISMGIPSQLLENRSDVRQAERQLEAAKLDLKVAKARFYPSLGISAGVGFQAFNPAYILTTPESLIYSAMGDLTAPLINRAALKSLYSSANATQIQAVYNYEQTVLNAYIEVANELSNISNLSSSYNLKEQQVQALNTSVDISNDLFRSARADYMEVLMTQRDALESRFDLIETKSEQLRAWISIYQVLGGGWDE